MDYYSLAYYNQPQQQSQVQSQVRFVEKFGFSNDYNGLYRA